MGQLYRRLLSVIGLAVLACTARAGGAEGIDAAAALGGIEQAKVVVSMDVPTAARTARYLERIHGLHRRLREQGVEPDLVLVFLDRTVRYLTLDPDELLAMESGDELRAIREQVRGLDRLGVRMEVGAVAVQASRLDRDAILPQVHLVGDGRVSLIGWQYRGYKLVPVF